MFIGLKNHEKKNCKYTFLPWILHSQYAFNCYIATMLQITKWKSSFIIIIITIAVNACYANAELQYKNMKCFIVREEEGEKKRCTSTQMPPHVYITISHAYVSFYFT